MKKNVKRGNEVEADRVHEILVIFDVSSYILVIALCW